MRRREFNIASLALTIAVRPALAQHQANRHRIAIVVVAQPAQAITETEGGASWRAFFEELRRLGYVEGSNLTVERYSDEGHTERWPELARQVTDRQPDLIVAVTGRMAQAMDLPGNRIPIVAAMADPIGFGFAKSLARPGGNITGVTADGGLEIRGKRLQILKEAVPSISNILLVAVRFEWEKHELQEASERLGIRLTGAIIDDATDSEYQRTLENALREKPDAMVVSEAAEHLSRRQLIVDFAAKHHIPTIYPFRAFVEAGGLMTYATDLGEVGRHLADYVPQVLNGAKPAETPIFQAVKFELVINLRTAKALGLTVPQALLARADEVIE
jgi:putative ABC transport system substrate-binding protein